MKAIVLAVALSAIAVGISDAAWAAAALPFTTFSVPGAVGVYPAGVNIHEVVAGSWQDQQYVSHGFVRAADGSLVTFDVAGAKHTDVYGINDKGLIVGAYQDAGGEQLYHGFTRQPDGAVSVIPTDPDVDLVATGINMKGDVCGFFYQAATRHEFLQHKDGTFVPFDVELGVGVDDISDSGEIAGTTQDGSGGQSGFVRAADGTITLLNTGGHHISLFNINNRGAVAGVDDTAREGFVWDAGNFSMFDPAPSSAHMNDNGVVAGVFGYPYEDRLFERNAKGKTRFLPPIPVSASGFFVSGFNNKGIIVGTEQGLGFLWKPGSNG